MAMGLRCKLAGSSTISPVKGLRSEPKSSAEVNTTGVEVGVGVAGGVGVSVGDGVPVGVNVGNEVLVTVGEDRTWGGGSVLIGCWVSTLATIEVEGTSAKAGSERQALDSRMITISTNSEVRIGAKFFQNI
jgi:hypothetical protein